MKVPLCIPDITETEKKIVRKVLDSNWLAHGKYNKKFEEMFANYIGTRYAISLNSCASALHLAIQASGIRGEILVPSFTFPASANAIINAGATPVFVDIRERTRNIDTEKLEDKITSRTEAIMPVHFAGHPCNMDRVMEIASKHELTVIEDSAETLGGTYSGKQAGSFGIGCFSFYPVKNLTTCEGGMLTTNDPKLANAVKTLSSHGIESSTHDREKEKGETPWKRIAILAGYNFRMANDHAALGLEQLKRLDDMNARRNTAAKNLTSKLQSVSEITTPSIEQHYSHSFQMYTILVKPAINRTAFLTYLRKEGVGASVHFDPPLHQHPAYEQFEASNLEVTNDVAERIVTLPMFPSITPEQLNYVATKVKEGVSKSKK